ncbi:bifunctional cystathionine gamma-lyase/homocysteine desulfhydrase [Staphylococcus aureus]
MNKKTQLIHGGQTTDPYTGAVTTPIYQTSTYMQDGIGDMRQGYEYSRSANPTRSALEGLIADLEQGESGFAFGSGMAAISAVIMLLDKGDHLLINSDVYGGTYRALTKVFNRFGIDAEFIDTTNIEAVEQYIKPETKMLYIETPSNPLLRVTDIKKSAEIAKKHHLISVVDNTFMTPYFQNPLTLGIDIVLHSATKYIGGHSDVVAGLVATSDAELAERLGFIQNSTGGVLGPQDSYLLIRGIKTLGLRMEQVQRNTLAIIDMLQQHSAVKQVFHPSISDHLNHDIHEAQSEGHTGVVAFEVADIESTKKVISESHYFTLAESLGAVESLISVPALMTHASIPKDIREKEGIADGLVRLSVGIEDTKDLVEDTRTIIKRIRLIV